MEGQTAQTVDESGGGRGQREGGPTAAERGRSSELERLETDGSTGTDAENMWL